ncbi:carbohydrate kinase family protein [Cohnella sp. CFH 77786]|uniref:carbohydrate kinase family protein n=1 Tax=Cohnella sp. CFH 77786 TaxID=2662265 RepID=UPI001C60CB4D
MAADSIEVVVAGHLCLDVIPRIDAKDGGMRAMFVPGKLVEIGPATIATGGAVSNTGLALHRLGVRAGLMGKIGGDGFGRAVLERLRTYGDMLAEGMIVAEGEHTSYSIVISPPGTDRVFLHCTGANDTFAADDLDLEAIGRAKLFHFGYPPLMRRMYEGTGEQLAKLLSRAKERGVTVSLDMARPDPASDAGRADWREILRRALPHVDLFLPSFDEILYMLRREQYEEMVRKQGDSGLLPHADGTLLRSIADELIAMGAAVVVLKLGEHGLYLRTAADPERLDRMGAGKPRDLGVWRCRELLAPCYAAQVVGTTGAGDCTIAGFLAGLLRTDGTPEQVLDAAVAVGAYNVEQADAVSGVPAWEQMRRRMESGWARRENRLPLPGWIPGSGGLWIGPYDRTRIG